MLLNPVNAERPQTSTDGKISPQFPMSLAGTLVSLLEGKAKKEEGGNGASPRVNASWPQGTGNW